MIANTTHITYNMYVCCKAFIVEMLVEVLVELVALRFIRLCCATLEKQCVMYHPDMIW